MTPHRAREAEIGELLARVGVRVKPMEWTNGGAPHTKALSVVGVYTINRTSGGRYQLNLNHQTPADFFPTVEAAKAAAQADYEARILSALSTGAHQ